MRSVDQVNSIGSCGQNLKVSKIAFDNLKVQQELKIPFPKMVENLIILLSLYQLTMHRASFQSKISFEFCRCNRGKEACVDSASARNFRENWDNELARNGMLPRYAPLPPG